ncbi:unnamed protein product [Lampetra planeri]
MRFAPRAPTRDLSIDFTKCAHFEATEAVVDEWFGPFVLAALIGNKSPESRLRCRLITAIIPGNGASRVGVTRARAPACPVRVHALGLRYRAARGGLNALAPEMEDKDGPAWKRPRHSAPVMPSV